MPRSQRIVLCANCQQEKPYYCKDMCYLCYKRLTRRKNPGVCSTCHKERPHIDGKGRCGACKMNEYKRRKGREYLDRHAARERARRQRLGEEYRAKDRKRNIQRREQRLAYNHAYYQAHKEQSRAWYLEYIKRRRDVAYAIKARYKARKAQLPATLTPQDWRDIKDGFGHRCVYCNRRMDRLTQDHIIPVTRGGGYTPDNIVPACGSCNSRKHTKDAFDFLIELATK